MKTTKFRVLRDEFVADPERARLLAEAKERLAADLAAGERSLPAAPRMRGELAAVWSLVQTARLTLRRLKPTDGPAMFRVHGDPLTNRYNPAGPHPDLATSEAMLQSCIRHWDEAGFGYWAVTLAGEEVVLGFGGVEYRRWLDREALNLYYRFTPGSWGRGYATELAQTAVALARAYLPSFPVIARTRSGNRASQRVAERAGLVRRPDLDSGHLVFALGWEAPPSSDEP
jgi:RimJ/RimL family protein N-acetyltransferase